MSATAVLLALAAMFGVGYGYSTGVRMNSPMDAMKSYCTTGNMRPNHGSMPQITQPPFELSASNIYRAGQPVEVTLRGKQGTRFMGFFITGDAESAAAGLTGDFAAVNPADSKKTTFCGLQGMTHTHNRNKTEVRIRWTPPREYHHGKIQFKATVVQSKDVFWTGVLSATVNPAIQPGLDDQESFMKKRAEQMMKNFQVNGGGMDFSKMMQNMGGMQLPGMPPVGGMQQGPPPPPTNGGMPPNMAGLFARLNPQG